MIGDIKTKLFLQRSVKSGVSKETIYKKLLVQGVSLDVIESLYTEAVGTQALSYTNIARLQDSVARFATVAAIVCVVLGMVTFIGASWSMLPEMMRIAILFSAMCLSYYVGWYILVFKHLKHLSHIAMLTGTMFLGASIFFIFGVYFEDNVGNALTIWFLFSTVVAIKLRSFSLHTVSSVLALTVVLNSVIYLSIHDELSRLSSVATVALYVGASLSAMWAAMSIKKLGVKCLSPTS